MHGILLNPLLPVPAIAALGVLLLAIAIWAYARDRVFGWGLRILLVALRAGAVAALLVLLLRPMRALPAPRPDQKPIFSVAVDVSGSMETVDVADTSRWHAARSALEREENRALWQLARDYQLNLRAFGGLHTLTTVPELKALDKASGLRTDLAGILQAVAQEATIGDHAGLCLISDGRDNAGGDVSAAIGLLRARQVPVWTACLGSDTDVRDAYLRARFGQNFLFAKQPGRLQVTVAQSGFDGFHANVHLYREDRHVESRQAVLRQGLVQIEFPIREDLRGLYQYTVRMDPLPGEADPRNNERVLFARVVDQKTRILVVEARPHWDSKFLLRALQEDPNLEVTSIFYLTPSKVFAVREQTSADTLEKEADILPLQMPRTREELYAYDCILLGKDMDTLLGAEELKMLRDYAGERGGGLVFFRGPAYHGSSDLADLEPVAWDDDVLRDVPLQLTEEGQLSPIFSLDTPQPADLVVRTLPAMTSFTRVRNEKSLAVVLATGQAPGVDARQLAALAYQRYGRGKVMTVSAGGMWRWSFLPDSLDALQGVYARLWAQIIRWLVFDSDFLPGQAITFRSERTTYQPGERVRFVIRTREVPMDQYRPRITVRGPEGEPEVISPTRIEQTADFVAFFTPRAEGAYRAILDNNVGAPQQDEARFTAYSDFEETRMVASDPGLMEHIARQTGGGTITLDQLDTLPERAREFAARAADTPRLQDAWDNGLVLAGIVGMLGLEWLLRRARGAL